MKRHDETAIVVRDLYKYYGDFLALKNINLTLHKGEVIAVLGPSGSGKSTFIRTLNGLENFQKGDIIINGIPLIKTQIEQVRREIGMVFQSFNLFPHLSILQNLTLAPKKVLGWGQKQAEEAALGLLRRIGIENQACKYPSQLSGGQQQRAAIARALVMQPKILLFDEPTSALDPEVTSEILDVIRELAQYRITLVIVTHEMGFAKKVADRILFFGEGTILEDSSSKSFFEHPSHERSQLFLQRVLKH